MTVELFFAAQIALSAVLAMLATVEGR